MTPGWYPDPHGRAELRWWDGTAWTHWSAMPGLDPWVDPAVATVDTSSIDPASAPPRPGAATVTQPEPAPSPSPAPHPTPAPPIRPRAEVRPGKEVARLVAGARQAVALLDEALLLEAVRADAARVAAGARRSERAAAGLASVSVEALAGAAGGGVRVAALHDAGHATAADVLRLGRAGLLGVPGVGEQTADRLLAVARQALTRAEASTAVTLAVDERTPAAGRLVTALVAWERARVLQRELSADIAGLAAQLRTLADAAQPATSRVGMWFRGRSKQVALDAASALATVLSAPATTGLLARVQAVGSGAVGEAEAWEALVQRPAELQVLLAELDQGGPRTESRTGHLPSEIVAEVEALELDTSLLDPGLTLRGYQRFGAQFALVRRRVILGDEMGLGKTVQAIAAMAHLAASGATHFAVICPAAVVVGWTRELERRSRLVPVKVHGDDKEAAFARWREEGGVAVTTYETARGLAVGPFGAATTAPVALLVVDECHYVKNPATQRTKAVRGWVAVSDHVLYMSGTPMENRVVEFKELVGHLQPEVAAGLSVDDGLLGAEAFRQAVAPVYLRRNQEDVLTELPERLDAEDWVEMDGPDLDAYRRAVAEGSFMAMRRAAYAPGTVEGSAKLDAVVDICDEAAEEQLKVVVFSFFRDVLDAVVAALGERAVGPITGDVAPAERQALVDAFTAAPGTAVLVGQIEAAGVGLNIQAGSVVVLCEPQWKPSTEEQAIARCHRMGQVRRVQVHRILATDSVDEHMRRIVAGKAEVVEAHVGTSATAQASPAAVDARDVPAEVEAEIVAAERTRLGLDAPPSGAPLPETAPPEAPAPPGGGAPPVER